MITFPDKQEGDKIYPDELNAIKLGINDQIARLNMVDGDAYTAFGSVANRIEALEKYVLLLTQHNKMLSTILTSALPDHFRKTVPQAEYDAIVAERDAKVAEVTQLQQQYEQAAQTDKAQIQQMIDEAITAAAQKEKEVETFVKEEDLESDIEIKSDDQGDYVNNQIYIKWNVVATNEDGTNGVEDVDQELLDKYNLTKVVQDTGNKGIVGTGLYQMPKGTNVKDVIEAVAQEQGLSVNDNKSIAQQAPTGLFVQQAPSANPIAKVVNSVSVNRNTPGPTMTSNGVTFVRDELFIRFRDGVDNAAKNAVLDYWKLDLKREFMITKANLYTIRGGWMYANRMAEEIEQRNWEHVKYTSLNHVGALQSR